MLPMGGFAIDVLPNFDNSNITVVATIDSYYQNITISPAAGSYGVDAKGTYTISDSKINLSFTTSSPSGASGYTCNMIMTKE